MTTGTVHRLTVPLSARDHVQGDLDARFALVEYGDYECPYSRQAFREIERVERQLGAGRMSETCIHLDSIQLTELPQAIRGCEDWSWCHLDNAALVVKGS